MRTLGIVVVYHPCIDDLISNINAYVDNINELIVWLNSPLTEQDMQKLRNGVNCFEKITMMGDSENQGIGYPLNSAIQYGKEHQYDYLLTMDQDSQWHDFSSYISNVFRFDLSDTMIYGPRTINAALTNDVDESQQEEVEPKEKDFVITSGAMYKLSLFDQVGMFREDYFIDAIDEEICYRAKKHGIRTVEIPAGYLLQHFGNQTHQTFAGRETTTPHYSAMRYYYITRNHLLLAQEPFVSKEQSKLMIWNYVLMPPIKVILFETQKIRKVKAICHGIWNGITKRMTKY